MSELPCARRLDMQSLCMETRTVLINSRLLACRIVLEGPLFEQYFKKVEVSNFEVASDAFTTFKVHIHCCELTARLPIVKGAVINR